jgi:hypothetical protein
MNIDPDFGLLYLLFFDFIGRHIVLSGMRFDSLVTNFFPLDFSSIMISD